MENTNAIQFWTDNKQYASVPLAQMVSPKKTREDGIMYLVKRKDRFLIVEDSETIATYALKKLPEVWKKLINEK